MVLSNIPALRDTRTYELCIGAENNRKTTFTKLGHFRYEETTVGILNGGVETHFWLRMVDGVFRLGRGSSQTPFEGTLVMETSDPAWFTVNSIRFVTKSVSGKWKIIPDPGDQPPVTPSPPASPGKGYSLPLQLDYMLKIRKLH